MQAAEEAVRTALETIETQAKTEAEATSKTAQDHVATLEELRARARALVGVIGRTGMSGGYQQDADKEESSANFWRKWTVGIAFVAAAVLAYAVYAAAFDEDVSTTRLVSKALLSGALGGIATYAARQSGHHRANARAARTQELKLASIGSYLEPLDADRQKEVLEVFAYLLFAVPTSAQVSGDGVEIGPTNIQALIEAIEKVRPQ